MINQMVPVLPLYELADHHVVGGALGGAAREPRVVRR